MRTTQKLSEVICRDKNYRYTHSSFDILTIKSSISHLICHFHTFVITNLHSLFFQKSPRFCRTLMCKVMGHNMSFTLCFSTRFSFILTDPLTWHYYINVTDKDIEA